MYKYDLGIIGGMSSAATVEIYKRIIERTKHSADQEHIRICILNNSIIPDRTKCILEGTESPLPYINESIKDLEEIGAKNFIIACNTAHYFSDGFKFSKINFINMIDETICYVKNNFPNKTVCVLGTTGTIKTKVYHTNNNAFNIDFMYLNEDEQQTIMEVITATKEDKNRNELREKLIKVIKNVRQRFSDVVYIIACTELSLYFKDILKEACAVDAMDCLVNSSIIKCGYRLK